MELGARLRLDDLRADAVEELEQVLHSAGRRLGAMTRAFLEQSPEHVTLVRDERDELRGYTIALTPESAPGFCVDDEFVGPRLEHARRYAGNASVVIWRDVVDLTGDPESGVIAMLGMAGILRAARGNPRFAYLVINPALPAAAAFSEALGAVHVPGLDVERGSGRVECHVLDYGPGGLLAAQRDPIWSTRSWACVRRRAANPSWATRSSSSAHACAISTSRIGWRRCRSRRERRSRSGRSRSGHCFWVPSTPRSERARPIS